MTTEHCGCDCHTHDPATKADLDVLGRALSRKIDKLGKIMSVSVEKLDADIQTLIAGYQAVVAQNVQLQAALDAAGATQAQAVSDAVAAEDADAQAKIDAADAIVAAATAPAAPPAGP